MMEQIVNYKRKNDGTECEFYEMHRVRKEQRDYDVGYKST